MGLPKQSGGIAAARPHAHFLSSAHSQLHNPIDTCRHSQIHRVVHSQPMLVASLSSEPPPPPAVPACFASAARAAAAPPPRFYLLYFLALRLSRSPQPQRGLSSQRTPCRTHRSQLRSAATQTTFPQPPPQPSLRARRPRTAACTCACGGNGLPAPPLASPRVTAATDHLPEIPAA
jgi:hypothetical protein